MERIGFPARNDALHFSKGFFRRFAFRSETQPVADAVNVSIDGKNLPTEREEKHTSCRFGSDAGERSQPLYYFIAWSSAQRSHLQITLLVHQSPENLFYSSAFLIGETSSPDRRGNRASGSREDTLPRRKPLPQFTIGPITVRVGGALREERRDQGIERFGTPARRSRNTEHFLEGL